MINLDGEKDQMAFDFMGNAYLVIPRSVLERALSPEEQERQAGMLHLALLAKCYHSDRIVLFLCTTNNEKVRQPSCPAFIIFVASLTQLTGRRRKFFTQTV